MARKRKGELPSGNVRTRVYLGKDSEGKKIYKSFTAPSRADLDAIVAAWKAARAAGETQDVKAPALTVKEAVERYISLKRAVLSPSTVRTYSGDARNYIIPDSIGARKVAALTQTDVQLWVSTLADTVAPKTVRNAYGLLISSVTMFRPEFRVSVTLPQKKPSALYCPSDEDVKRLLDHIKGTELEVAVLLGAFGLMRRSEICALNYEDIRGNAVTISKALVHDETGGYSLKAPKTDGSHRTVILPDFVVKRIGKGRGRIIRCAPHRITARFEKAVARAGVPHFRFHDLRHYGASIMHAIGVPDQYIMQRGGWSSDSVMKRVYRNAIGDEARKQTAITNEHFAALMSG